MPRRRGYTREQEEMFLKHLDWPTIKLAAIMGKSEAAVRNKRYRLIHEQDIQEMSIVKDKHRRCSSCRKWFWTTTYVWTCDNCKKDPFSNYNQFSGGYSEHTLYEPETTDDEDT